MAVSANKNRRDFLKQGSSLAAVGISVPYFVPSTALAAPGRSGANDRINIGVIGTGSRARMLMNQTPDPGRIVAICDCYHQRMVETVQQLKTDWPMYDDYRQMIDKENLDAVIVGTPDHGRVLPCIHACQAGLDVYAEKPLTLTISEGRVLVNAARKYERVFQVGSQQRTMEMNRFACELVRSGGIGKLKVVKAVCYTGPKRYEGLAEAPVPEGDNWDAWQSQAEERAFSPHLQFGWMQWRSYSGGEMTNWGAHGVDQIQCALGMSQSGPVEIWPTSPGPNGKLRMRYANDVEVHFELEKGPLGGCIVVGEDCKIEINRNKFTTNPKDFVKDPPNPAEALEWEGPGWIAKPHIKNWLDCIKTREKPNADVEIGHRSISVCHLANIAREIGRKLKWDPETETFPGDEEANAYLSRPRRKGYELPELL
ncbi:MAG: Gfo/Idh/MocA family oxidoreductase [Planctomycetes bacterium]|nr:Gfo/Idh/MocA family oxidoreductase [Planctomycetota bacterium]